MEANIPPLVENLAKLDPVARHFLKQTDPKSEPKPYTLIQTLHKP